MGACPKSQKSVLAITIGDAALGLGTRQAPVAFWQHAVIFGAGGGAMWFVRCMGREVTSSQMATGLRHDCPARRRPRLMTES